MRRSLAPLWFALFLLPATPFAAAPKPASPATLEAALELYSGGDLAGAAQAFEALTRRDPRSAAAWLYFGVVRLGQGREKEAGDAFARATALDRAGALAEARASVRGQVLSSALASLGQGELEDALRAAELAERLGPDPEARYAQALSLARLGRAEEARARFAAVAQDPSASPELRQQARRLAAARAERRRGPWLLADLSLGVNTNARAAGFSQTQANRGTRNAYLGAGATALDQASLSIEPDYGFSVEDTAGFPEDRFIRHRLRARVRGDLGRGWSLAVTPFLQHDRLGADPLTLRGGAVTELEKRWNELSVGLYSETSRSVALSEAFANFSGFGQLSRLYGGYERGGFAATLGLAHQRESISPIRSGGAVLPLANTSYGPSLNVSWDATPRIRLESRNTYWFRSYDDRAFPLDERRVDDQTLLTLQASYQADRGLRPYVLGTYHRNRSTLDALSVQDKNFRQWIAQLGVTWEYAP